MIFKSYYVYVRKYFKIKKQISIINNHHLIILYKIFNPLYQSLLKIQISSTTVPYSDTPYQRRFYRENSTRFLI